MGESLGRHGEFVLPYGDASEYTGVPSYSHHYSPLFPAYLAAVYSIFGSSILASRMAALVMSLLAVAVVIWATKDLYGLEKALVAGAIVSIDYELIIETGKVYSESMTLVFFTLTMWAILRGVKNDRYIVLAGFFASLAYLARSALGYFFIIAGVGGFLWRFYYMRWKVFTNKYYMIAIGIFLVTVGAWSLRNVSRFGWPNWETSLIFQRGVAGAWSDPLRYLSFIVVLIPFFILILGTYAAFWLPELRASLRRIKNEEVSGLWLAIVLVPFTLLFIAGVQSFFESQHGLPPFLRDRYRYLVFAFVPIVWLAVRNVDFRLNTPLTAILKKTGIGLAAIKSRGYEIARNREWLLAIVLVSVAGVASLIIVGGWLAAFLLVAVPALLFRSPRKRLAIFLAILLAFSAEASTGTVKFSASTLGADLNSLLGPTDVVAVDNATGHELYLLFPYIGNAEDRVVPYRTHQNAPYLVSYVIGKNYENYAKIGYYYDEIKGGWISQAIAYLRGSDTETRTLTAVLWKHN